MKNILYISLLLLVATNTYSQVNTCCPKFNLQQQGAVTSCPGDSSCKEGSHNGGPVSAPGIIACKNSVQTYHVFPNMPGFTYNWQVVGGTPLSFTGNPAIITWGSGSQGFIQIIISDASGSCRDTIRRKICLIDAPIAAFTYTPVTTICTSQSITFANTSTGASAYSWDFGDGQGSPLANPPPHTYANPGYYTVVLTVSNGGGGGAGNSDRCGCTDTATAIIHVIAGNGPVITSPNCKKMLCPGDTATYCVSPSCPSYSWTVNGGSIVGSATGQCVKILWNSPPAIYPTSVTVTTGCTGSCSNTATLNVPVLYNNIPISGPDPVCVGTTATYSLPVLPGTFYSWNITGGGGGTIVSADSNAASVNIQWNGPPGNAVVTCSYTNPYSGCSGTTSMPVKVKKRFIINGPSPVCVNSGGYYSVSGGGTANWKLIPTTGFTPPGVPPGSFNSVTGISLTWNNAGVYTITAKPVPSSPFCNDSSVISVVVNPKPVLSVINGLTSICPGNYYTYSVSSNMSGSFVWSAVNGTIVSQMGTNNDSVVVQWSAAVTHSISVSQTVNGCTSSATLSPITNIPPPTISPNATACRDQSLNYTTPGSSPPGSYSWSIAPAAAGTITVGQGTNAITVLWHGTVVPGTSTAILSLTVCGNTVTQTITITTPPNGTIATSGTLCATGISLTVSPSMPCYQWYLNGVLLPTTTATHLAVLPGYYEVKCATGCAGYASIFIPKEPIPNASITANGPTSYCTGATINLPLVALNTPGYMYQWYNASGPIVGQTNATTSVTSPGSYYVVITWGNCKDTSNIINVVMQNCDPNCTNYVYMFSPEEKKEILAGPAPAATTETAFVPTLNINFPISNCNNALFSGTYSVNTPWTFNSGIHWDFGDGSPIQTSGNAVTISHNYTVPGYYFVTAWITVICPPDGRICTYLDTATVYVPLASYFEPQVNCGTVYLNNQSQSLPGCSFTSAWTVTSGPAGWSFSSPTAFNPILTVTQSGTYTIQYTMNSVACNCVMVFSQTVTVNLPSASFIAPTPVCAGTPVSFSAPSATHYLWNFGDGYTSTTQLTQHAFGLTPPNPVITLTVTDAAGCTATASNTINVIAAPALNITPTQFICPGTTTIITATGAGFSSYTWYQNGVQVQTGPSNTYGTGTSGTYYVVANSSNGACAVTSAQTHIFYKPKPIANIQGNSVACLSAGIAYIYLYNSVSDPNNTYNWNLQGNPASLSTNFDLNTTVNATGNYSYVLTVTNSDGCIARDTFCVVVGESPQVTVTPSSGGVLCAGTLHMFTASATPANPNYIYQWSNGVTGITMSTSLPGMYSVTVINPANGCTGFGFAGMIQPRPSTLLFPIGCDTLCDYDSIIPPLALGAGQNIGIYTVQWFLNGNYATPIYTGPVLNLAGILPPLIYGMNNISIVVTYNGCSDTSNTYNLFIKKCGDCNCDKSSWGTIELSKGDKVKDTNPGFKAVVIGQGDQKLECKGSYTLNCNQAYTINAFYNCSDTTKCPPKVTYSLQPPSGLPITGTVAANFTPTQSGTYTLTLYGWCGNNICDSCVITFKVACKECDCKGSKWDAITISPAPGDHPLDAKVAAANIPAPAKLNCGKTYDAKCNTSYTINAGYICAAPDCAGSVQYILNGPLGTSTGNVPVNFTPTATGVYTLTLYGYCGTTRCDSCIIKFNVKCDSVPPPPCCPYNISVKDPVVQTSVLATPPATIANAQFGITGPSGNLFTEIRATVISYNLYSNFNNECLNCKSYPYTWSSMYQPGNIWTMPPQITMYGGATVTAFNPAGSGMYQNPREVIWNNGNTAFSLPPSINLSFLLPPASIIDCCELTAKICVKFTFRDKDCKECESIICFSVVIKPGGAHTDPKECNCSIKPVIKYEGGSKPIGCGETISLFAGNIPVSLLPNFQCKDQQGKDCESSGLKVTIKKPDNSVQTLTSPNYNYTYTLSQPGLFQYTVSAICGGKKCECQFNVQIPKK